MQPVETTETDTTARVVPPPQASAPWRVKTAAVKRDRCLTVTFEDGTAGYVHLGDFLEAAEVTGTVFEALRDPDVFAQARVDLGAVAWPNGADLSPDAMYDAIRAQGHWNVDA